MNLKRSTLLAVGAFAVLLTVVLLTREQRVSVGVQKLALPTIDPSAVTAIDVSGASAAKLTLENGAWSVADPATPDKRFAADEGQVKNALTQLSELRAGDFVTENAAKHGELEIDEAKGLRVAVAAAGSKALLDVFIGKAARSGGSYVRLAGSNAVFTTRSSLSYALRKTVAAWRKKAITTAPLAEVSKLTVAPPEGDGFTLVQGDGNAWSLEGGVPKAFRFDAATAARVAQTLTSLTAQDFVNGDAANAGFTGSHLSATLSLKDGQTKTLHFASAKRADGSVEARVDGDAQTYVVSGYVFDQLPKHLSALRETTLFSFSPDKVTQVTLRSGAKRVMLKRDGASWKLVEPKTAPPEFDAAQVSAVLMRLSSMRAARVAEATTAERAGLTRAQPSVELVLEGDGTPQRLTFGSEVTEAANGKQFYVKGSADDLVYLANAGDKAWLDSGIAVFNKPPPPPQNMGQMQGLESLPPDIRAKIEAQLRGQQGTH